MLSRRSLLQVGAKGAATLGLSSLLGPVSSAATLDRGCVCIYLLGGNDSNNMFVPLDSPGYDDYARGRGALAIPAGDLLPVKAPASSANYGFHPALGGVQDLYNRGLLSVVANVGRAGSPFGNGRLNPGQTPSDLFLHTADPQVRYLPQGHLALAWDRETFSTLADDALAGELRLTDRLARVAAQLSASTTRATFTVALSGFDTHADQLATQTNLFAELNEGLVSFYENLHGLGLASSVTVFTMSEFNRTLAPNARGGSDHGWGGHNLVLGGGVRGGDVYGRFPSLQLGGADDLAQNGTWKPSVSDQQFSAAIARWYGVADLGSRFPQLRNFASLPDVDFLSNR